MKTKNIFRMFLLAVTLLVGVNGLRAEIINLWKGDATYNTITITKDKFASYTSAKQLLVYAGNANVQFVTTKNDNDWLWSSDDWNPWIYNGNRYYNAPEGRYELPINDGILARLKSDGFRVLNLGTWSAGCSQIDIEIEGSGGDPTPTKTDITLTFSSSTAEATIGESFTAPTLTATAGDETVTGLAYSFSSSDEGVATVDNSGNITLVAAGTTTITAAFAGNDSYNEATASYELTVSEAEIPDTPIETVTATISSSTGYATFCSDKDLDFSTVKTLKAYIAKEVADNEVKMVRVSKTVAAGTGLVLKGATAEIPVAETGISYSDNLLVGVLGGETTINSSNQYVLVDKDGTAKFADTAGNAANVPVGKAYLEVTSGSRILFFSFDDDATAISSVNMQAKQTVYNLKGLRVENSQRGLYIVNGKKVIK